MSRLERTATVAEGCDLTRIAAPARFRILPRKHECDLDNPCRGAATNRFRRRFIEQVVAEFNFAATRYLDASRLDSGAFINLNNLQP
jgi:hypothetical protein